ncbi:MAG: class I SAM-dependent RNA methyltransferase [Paracoccaceae bacterium]
MRLTVERLGHLGDGVAGDIFVPMALPGEVVEGEVSGGRMAAPVVVTPSAHRVAPHCPHYGACGGCSLMHANDGFVAAWKDEVVREALAAQGLGATFRAVVTSPGNARRRATLAGRRTKTGAAIGFNGRASGTIAGIPGCRLLSPEILAHLPALKELTALGASRSAVLHLTVTEMETGADVAVSGGKDPDSVLRSGLAAIAGRAGFARLTWNGETLAQRVVPVLGFGRARVAPPPGAFLQATAQGEAALAEGVAEALNGARRLADLFAGCGTFALRLAEQAEVHAVEGDAAMTLALDAAARATPGLRRLTTERRDLFRRPLLSDELARFDAAVIDPPRAGAAAQAAEIARSGLKRVAYVSCNPATFARDARILTDAGFRILWVRVVDQFRWSPHVELVAAFFR